MPINVFTQRNRNLIQNSLFELDILWSHVSSVIRAADLSIFHEFVPPPTGGGTSSYGPFCEQPKRMA